MPGGLPGVEQTFTAETAGYIAGIQAMIEANRGLIKSIAEVNAAIGSLKDKEVRITADNGDAMRGIAEVKAALDGIGDKEVTVAVKYVTTGDRPDGGGIGLGGDSAAMIRELRDISASMDQATSSMGRMEDHMMVISKNAQDSSADLMMQTQILRDNADAHNAAATAAGALAAAQGRGRGGGGDGAALAAAAGAAAGAGGGGGGLSFNPLGGNFWQAMHFWTMMTGEVAATVLPALTAAGTGALVGVQSVEAMLPRYKAVFTTSEALGDAYGMTTGKFLGGGTALQDAQNAYQGAGYDIAGSLLSIIQGGGGKGFIGMGEQTLSMLARGTAATDINFQQGNIGKKLSDALSGGPEYLRQFGDIGANLGNLLLNVAPNLPGAGQDILSTLQGGTGLLATLTRDIPAPILGGALAAEAGWRWGGGLLGGGGLIGKMLGLSGVGGLGGLISKGGIALGGLGESGGLLESLGLGISGFGEGLAGLGAPELLPLGLGAFLGTKLYGSMPGSAQRQVGGLQTGINAAGFTAAWQPLGAAITTATGLGMTAGQSRASQEGIGATETPFEIGRFGPMGPTTADIYRNAATGFASQMGDLVNSGPQLKAALAKAGLKSVSLGDAFQIAQNALLDMGHAFGKDGKLTPVAMQMVENYAKVIGPMTQSSGAFGAAVAGQTIMSQGAMENLAKVNSAMDSYQQIIAGGPTGSGLAAAAGAVPAGQMAKALTSFTSPGGASAWQAFASTSTSQPGFVTQMQQFNDQMRTYLTLGTATTGQTQGFSGFELKSLLPQARQSPAALAMLMQQGAQAGITGYYDQGKSQAQNYKDAAVAISKMAYSSAQFNKNMNAVTVATSNMPAVAKQFADQTATSIQSQEVAKAAQDAMNIKGGINIKANVGDLVSQLRAAGVQGGAALKQSLDAVLTQAGVSKAMIAKINVELTDSGALGKLAQIKAALAGLPNVTRTVDYNVAQALAGAHSAAIAGESVPNIVRYITYVVNEIYKVTGSPGGVPYTPAGIAANAPALYTKPMSTGGMVPGFGSGDHVPALLEPGEAIVPRYLVPLIAPILKSHHVPGFAAGGIVPAGTLAGVDAQLSSEWKTLDALYAKEDSASGSTRTAIKAQVAAFWKDILDPLYKAKDAFHDVSKSAASTAASTKAATTAANTLATSIANKFTTAMNFARGVSGAASAGQGFGTTGLLSGVDTTQTSVGQYMTDYLTSEQGFTKDLGTLTKGGLNKSLIQQLVAAGPQQGDLLAQSILQQGGTTGAAGGISQINKLWQQIGAQSHALGSQAAMSIYGQSIAPNLKSGTVTSNNISINVNVPSGSGANLNLTTAQVKEITAAVEAALLKQAKRNRATGVALPGKGA